MEVRTDFPSSMYHTKLQWAQLGKALNADAVGIEMWVNSCQINSAIFYTVDEYTTGHRPNWMRYWSRSARKPKPLALLVCAKKKNASLHARSGSATAPSSAV